MDDDGDTTTNNNTTTHQPTRRRRVWWSIGVGTLVVVMALVIVVTISSNTGSSAVVGKDSSSESSISKSLSNGSNELNDESSSNDSPTMVPPFSEPLNANVTSTTTTTMAVTMASASPTEAPSFSPVTVQPTSPPSTFVTVTTTITTNTNRPTRVAKAMSFRPSTSPSLRRLMPTNSNNEIDIPTVVLKEEHQDELRCNNGTNLCDRPVNEILFATVHNAASTTANGFTILPNHQRNLTEALYAGYRGINVDIGICNGVLGLVHSFCFLGFDADLSKTFQEIADFLLLHENEVLLMPTQLDFSTGGEFSLLELEAVIPVSFLNLLYEHPINNNDNNNNTVESPWPTLRELIVANQRILFFHYNGERCSSNTTTCPYGFMNWFDYAAESEYSHADVVALQDKDKACRITRGEKSTSFYGVNVFTTLANPEACAVWNNAEFLRHHIASCANITQRKVNLVLIDCWDVGDVLDVVHDYNQEL